VASQVYSRIRQMSASFGSTRVAAAEFECTVYVWDLAARKRVAVLETPLDFGGRRLAINPQGSVCATASYKLGGLTCYSVDSGSTVLLRGDLKRLNFVSFSGDGALLYCGSERGPLKVLDAETGADVRSYPSTDSAYCGPHGPFEVVNKRQARAIELRRGARDHREAPSDRLQDRGRRLWAGTSLPFRGGRWSSRAE
jgi:WD40 repeat protein